MGTLHIPAVKTSLGLHVVGDSCFAPPGSGVSVENMEIYKYNTCTVNSTSVVNKIQSYDKHTVAIQPDCLPPCTKHVWVRGERWSSYKDIRQTLML